jgi:hypothetical protein
MLQIVESYAHGTSQGLSRLGLLVRRLGILFVKPVLDLDCIRRFRREKPSISREPLFFLEFDWHKSLSLK